MFRTTKHLSRTIWKKWSGYHRRSLLETKMHHFKLFGQRVARAPSPLQITELKIRTAILDNLHAHKGAAAREASEATGARMLFFHPMAELPPDCCPSSERQLLSRADIRTLSTNDFNWS